MEPNKVFIGNWVEFDHKKGFLDTPKRKLGFVVNVSNYRGVAKVAVPEDQKTYDVLIYSLKERNDVEPSKKDIDAMIDLALDLRWFDLLEELHAEKYGK
nr:hypothetical protein 12 [Bacillaceae bacterium]